MLAILARLIIARTYGRPLARNCARDDLNGIDDVIPWMSMSCILSFQIAALKSLGVELIVAFSAVGSLR